MSTSLVSVRLRVSKSIFAAILVLMSCVAAFSQQANSHPPQIWLSEPQSLSVNHVSALAAPLRTAPSRAAIAGGVSDPVATVTTGAANLGQPVSMSSADFDEDGVSDLVVGYKGAQGASIAIHRGNLDAFAPQSDASFQAIGRGEFPSPFVTDAQVIGVPLAPDFIVTGNFAGNGHKDIVVASRGGTQLYLLPGDGKGNFGVAQTVNLPAGVTAMASGEFGGGNGYDTLLVAISSSPRSAALAILRGTAHGFSSAAALPLNAPATAFAFGNLDGEPGYDAAILAGGQVFILHSASLMLEDTQLSSSASSVAVGSFVNDRVPGMQIALLNPNGSIFIAAHNDFDPRAYSLAELQSIRQSRLLRQPNPLLQAPSAASSGWKVVETISGVPFGNSAQPPLFFRTRISSNAGDDLMVLDSSSGQMALVAHPDVEAGAANFLPAQVTIRPYSDQAVDILPVRVNVDGRPGIVALHQGTVAPVVMMPLPDPTFFVNRFDDPAPGAVATTCNNASNVDTSTSCSLREAIRKANNALGTDTIMLVAGTYTLTQPRVANDFTAAHGTLDVADSVNITGAVDGSGNPASIVQACDPTPNPTCNTGVDKVFSFNQDIASFTNATVSVSNLVIRFGHNRGAFGGLQDGFGGAFDFDTGGTTPGTGNANLTITNCTITDNVTTDGDGGGVAVFNTNSGSGFAHFVNSTIQNNSPVRVAAGAVGGGIFVGSPARIVLDNTKIINNNATEVSPGKGQGGGIFAFGGPSPALRSAIHASTISGNNAAGDGGGVETSAGLIIDTGSIISNNTSGGNGGGFWYNALNETADLTKVAITGNSATGGTGATPGGGGIYVSSGVGVIVNMSFSRLAGNTAPNGNNLDRINGGVGASVNAADNWWGVNAPAATINGTVTFDPFIVLTHSATPAKIRINQSTTLTGDMSKDNHANAVGLANLDRIIGLPITFDNAVLGSIPQAQPETLNASAQATATFNAGGTSGRGSANATVDQAVIGANSNFIASATEVGTTATITTVGTHNFSVNQTVVIAGVGVGGYNGTFTINTVTPPTQFTYTATAGLAPSSGGTAKVGIIILEPPHITKTFGAATIPINGTTTVSFSINNPNVVAINASFTDTLPAGLLVAATPGVTNSCGGTVTAVAGAGSISFSNNLTPIGVCTITVNITGTVDNN